MSEEYKVSGSFCNQSISGFKRYIKDGVLDVEAVMRDFALNERQIPRLIVELEAAGYLEAESPTAPLHVKTNFGTGTDKLLKDGETFATGLARDD